MIDNRLHSVDEITAYIGIKPPTVYKWIERRKMPAHKVAWPWKSRSEQIDKWVKSGKAIYTKGE